MNARYDVIVVGGGHAGCEAAAAAARMGASTALVTHKVRHHRRDVLQPRDRRPRQGPSGAGDRCVGRLMGRVADRGGIQFRVLNRRKGPAVRGPRAQADRALYAAAMQEAIENTDNLAVVEAEADDLICADGRVCGLKLADGRELQGRRRGADHRHVPARAYSRGRAANPGRTGRGGAGHGAFAARSSGWASRSAG